MSVYYAHLMRVVSINIMIYIFHIIIIIRILWQRHGEELRKIKLMHNHIADVAAAIVVSIVAVVAMPKEIRKLSRN